MREVEITGMDVYRDRDTIHILLEEENATEPPKLLYLVTKDEGRSFSKPKPIPMEFPPVSGHRGNDPQIAASGNQLIAVWTGRGTGYAGRGKMGVALSLDGGRHWFPGGNPADDMDVNSAHGFMDLAYDSGGRCHIVWLDERNGAVGLRAAYSDDGGKNWSANRTIDPKTCTCCPNTLLSSGPWLFVLYRMDTPRDTALARSSDRGESWEQLGSVGDFHWEFQGCPHWGSGMTLLGSGKEINLFAAVQTGKLGSRGLYVFQSKNLGRSWSVSRLLSSRGRFIDLASCGHALCAAWEESLDKSAQILAAYSLDDGRSWTTPHRMSDKNIWATHPRVVATRDGFLILWTEKNDSSQLCWNIVRINIQ